VATKLTKRTVDAIKPRDKTFIVFDSDIKGFGARIAPSGGVSFVLEYRPGAGGRGVAKRRLTLGRYGQMTLEQGRQAALTALAGVRLGSDPQAEKTRQRAALSLADLIEQFLTEHVGTKLKPKTKISYEDALANLLAAYGTHKAATLSRAQLSALHRSMAAIPYRANKMLAVTSSAFLWAGNQGLLPEGFTNPATKITRYKEHARERFLTGEELSRLGDALRTLPINPFAAAAIRLLILTGARLREILHARWENVDIERGILFLPDSKTGKKPLFLNAPAIDVLGELPRFADNPHVICGRKPGAHLSDLDGQWRAVKKAARLEGVRLHDLRHSNASVGADSGYSLQVIGRLLGHSRITTTERYAHLANDPVRAASEVIGARISSAMAGANRRRCANERARGRENIHGVGAACLWASLE
jgi:integrase